MDDELLKSLYHYLIPHRNGQGGPRCFYKDGLLTLIYFFAVIRDRSGRWACRRANWPLHLRRLVLPSYSQFNRRLKTPAVASLIRQVNDDFRQKLPCGGDKLIDGKPLMVGGYSKDPDAAFGKVPDGWATGYKLHAIVDQNGHFDAFEVTALDRGEATVARELIGPMDLKSVVVRGDSNYDSNPLYKAVADRGGRLIAPRKKPGTGLGHHPQQPDRLRAIQELEDDNDEALKEHRRLRNRVEQTFAHVTNLPCGISPLPNFVRRLSRVRRWITGKIGLFHLQRYLLQAKAQAA